MGEGFGALLREGSGEGEDGGGVDAGGGEQIESFGERGRDEGRACAGAQQMRGMRLLDASIPRTWSGL